MGWRGALGVEMRSLRGCSSLHPWVLQHTAPSQQRGRLPCTHLRAASSYLVHPSSYPSSYPRAPPLPSCPPVPSHSPAERTVHGVDAHIDDSGALLHPVALHHLSLAACGDDNVSLAGAQMRRVGLRLRGTLANVPAGGSSAHGWGPLPRMPIIPPALSQPARSLPTIRGLALGRP